MESIQMRLKVLMPYKVFTEIDKVTRIVVETDKGSLGILPHRLDGVAMLVPGILIYATALQEESYVAIDEGILVKTGLQALVSVRNAIGGFELGKLHEAVVNEFKNLNEQEKNIRLVVAKLESSFIRSLRKFHK